MKKEYIKNTTNLWIQSGFSLCIMRALISIFFFVCFRTEQSKEDGFENGLNGRGEDS